MSEIYDGAIEITGDQLAMLDKTARKRAEAEETSVAGAGQAPKRTRTVRISQVLPVPLTPAQYEDACQTLARIIDERQQLENQRKSVNADFKAQIDAKDAEGFRLTRLVRERGEWKTVMCDEITDYDEATVTVVRRDTGEIVRTRTLLTDERQMKIPEADGAAKEEG